MKAFLTYLKHPGKMPAIAWLRSEPKIGTIRSDREDEFIRLSSTPNKFSRRHHFWKALGNSGKKFKFYVKFTNACFDAYEKSRDPMNKCVFSFEYIRAATGEDPRKIKFVPYSVEETGKFLEMMEKRVP